METLNDEEAAKAGIEGMEDADENLGWGHGDASRETIRSSRGSHQTSGLFRSEGDKGDCKVEGKCQPVQITPRISNLDNSRNAVDCEDNRPDNSETEDSGSCALATSNATKRRISFRHKIWTSFDENSPLPAVERGTGGGLRRSGPQTTPESALIAQSPPTPSTLADSETRNVGETAPALLPLTAGNIMR